MDKTIKRLKPILLPLLLVVVVVASFIPYPVYAATQDLAVDGEGSETGGTYTPVVGTFAYMNSEDADTSYLRATGTTFTYHSWTTQNYVGSDDITNVRVTYQIYGGVSAQETPYILIGGAKYYGTLRGLTGWATFTDDWATNPATGIAWTAAQINAAEFGMRFWGGAAFSGCSYLKVTVTYTLNPPSVTTNSATGIEYTGGQHKATLNGIVTDDGGATVDYYGFVWDTVDEGDPGNQDPSLPPGAWASGWKSAVGDYGENSFSHQITGLIINTTYFYRAAAHNSQGWSYGAAISFRTLTNPSITTLAATNIATTTARLNALVTDDGKLGGGENCTVTFIYVANAGAHHANYAAILGAGGTEVAAAGTYNTGGLPYYDIGGLVAATNYDFAVKITNTVSTQYGGVLWFTTDTGVFTPTNFVAIPTSTTISLSWVKGAGSSNTFIRYDTATFPTLITGGLATVYAGTGSSYLMTGLTPGQNYYFSAWGLNGGVYSAGYITVMATCLAEGADTVPTLPKPDTPGSWSLTPSTATIGNLPFYSFVNFFADNYDIPPATMWYGLFIVFSVGAGLFAYWRGNQNLLVAIFVCAVGLVIGSIMGLVYLWILVFFLLAGISMAWLAQRY